MNHPVELKYTKDHAWIRVEDNVAYIGITDFAQDQLGEILFVDLPEEDTEYAAGDVFTEIESSKTTSEVPCPLSGKVLEANAELDDSPENINDDPYANWIIKLEISDEAEIDDLISAAEYEASIEE